MQVEAEKRRGLVECSLAELPPVTLELVTEAQNWQRWKELVERYYYLGVKQPADIGYGLLEGRLYLPKLWFSPEYQQRREACHVLKEVAFATKIKIALELLRRQTERGIFHAPWVACDSFLGVDSAFRDDKPGIKQWLILRRLEDGQLKYYLSNASARVAKSTLRRALVRRWPIEQCFEDGKKHLGMDHYENRTWAGWHRHMLYATLAMLFLLRLRLRSIKNSNAHPAPGPAFDRCMPGSTTAGQAPRAGDPALLHQAQLHRLSRPPQARPSEGTSQPLPLIQSHAIEGRPHVSP